MAEFLRDPTEIEAYFKQHFTTWDSEIAISDGKITVQGNTQFKLLKDTEITELQIEFADVTGDFLLTNARFLKSLRGAPASVGGDFSCDGCWSLKSLEGLPRVAGTIHAKGLFSLTALPVITSGGLFEVSGFDYAHWNMAVVNSEYADLDMTRLDIRNVYTPTAADIRTILETSPDLQGANFFGYALPWIQVLRAYFLENDYLKMVNLFEQVYQEKFIPASDCSQSSAVPTIDGLGPA